MPDFDDGMDAHDVPDPAAAGAAAAGLAGQGQGLGEGEGDPAARILQERSAAAGGRPCRSCSVIRLLRRLQLLWLLRRLWLRLHRLRCCTA